MVQECEEMAQACKIGHKPLVMVAVVVAAAVTSPVRPPLHPPLRVELVAALHHPGALQHWTLFMYLVVAVAVAVVEVVEAEGLAGSECGESALATAYLAKLLPWPCMPN